MSNHDGTGGTGAPVQSVDRAITVLELLATQGEAGITEIASELGVHKSTVSRLVSVLEARGLVEQISARGKYVIGFGVVRLAGAATGRMDLAKLGRATCQSLADELGETVNIAIVDTDVAINITQAHGSSAVIAQNWVGQRTPLHATSSGKVLFANLPADDLEHVLGLPLAEYTPRTMTDVTELRAELERVVTHGYARCFEELELGLHAVAVPVRDQYGGIVASISASGPSYRLSRRRTLQLVEVLADAAADLSAQLGYIGS